MITILDQLIQLYPHWMDFSEGTNNLLYAKLIGYFLKDVDTQKTKIDMSQDIEYPLQLWRNQINPYNYTMEIEVHLLDIQQVQLYKINAPLSYDPDTDNYQEPNYYNSNGDLIGSDMLLADSGPIPSGLNIFSSSFGTSSDDIIPVDKYYLIVSDWHDHTFYKGFPENDVPQGNIYDKQADLDILGKLFQIPRREYSNTDLEASDYTNTTPPYCIDGLEWDYVYKERIKELMQAIQTKSLAEVEFYRLYGVYPSITNRSHSLFVMGNGIPGDPNCGSQMFEEWECPNESEAKFLMTQEWLDTTEWWGMWNSCVYDITCDLNLIPANIKLPTATEVENLVTRTLGISKIAVCTFKSAQPMGTDILMVVDSFNLKVQMTPDVPILYDTYSMQVSGGGDEEGLLLTDELTVLIENRFYTDSADFLRGNINIDNIPVLVTERGTFVYGNIKTGNLVDKYGNRYFIGS